MPEVGHTEHGPQAVPRNPSSDSLGRLPGRQDLSAQRDFKPTEPAPTARKRPPFQCSQYVSEARRMDWVQNVTDDAIHLARHTRFDAIEGKGVPGEEHLGDRIHHLELRLGQCRCPSSRCAEGHGKAAAGRRRRQCAAATQKDTSPGKSNAHVSPTL